jgi:iron complex outermembrane receptor protein
MAVKSAQQRSMGPRKPWRRVATVLAALELLAMAPAQAGSGPDESSAEQSPSLMEIVVTATKKGRAENIQEVPIAMTAFESKQLEAQSYQNLTSLAYAMPNVQLDANGTTSATANFSIRGLAINSAIPSVEPSVGIFVDGVYMGIAGGVLFDNFDLDSVEVLRGPQGVLFGRNVTAGAVVINTKAPADTFSATGHVAIEQDPNVVVDGAITGPLVPGVLDAKLAVYRDDDKGWFRNLFNGARTGANYETITRPSLRWTPVDSLSVTLRYEHGENTGDGSAAQNHGLYSRDSFDFSNEDTGHKSSSWDQTFVQADWKVDFGNGRITNIAGWRQFQSRQHGDIDATGIWLIGANGQPVPTFDAAFLTRQNQRSEELRYAGTFGPAELTTGFYYFEQYLDYVEQRTLDSLLLGAPPPPFPFSIAGGGIGDSSTTGLFANTDWALSESWKLNLGLRFTHEWTKAAIASEVPGGGSAVTDSIVPNFHGSHSWSDVSPRVGVQWQPGRGTHLYALWDKGFRSGGYNFRSTDSTVSPGPTNPETVNNFEAGLKQDFLDGRARVNLAAFDQYIDNIQREVNLPSATAGVTQEIINAGNARIWGAEFEGIFRASTDLTLSAQAGYTTGHYTKLLFGIDSDPYIGVNPTGAVDSASYHLQLPRLAPWTYGVGAAYDVHLGPSGILTTRANFNHRDKEYFTDNNAGFFNPVDMLDAGFTWVPASGPATFSLYGKNLLNAVTYGGDTILPPIALFGYGGPGHPLPTFSPLNKGRVIGAEVRVKF